MHEEREAAENREPTRGSKVCWERWYRQGGGGFEGIGSLEYVRR